MTNKKEIKDNTLDMTFTNDSRNIRINTLPEDQLTKEEKKTKKKQEQEKPYRLMFTIEPYLVDYFKETKFLTQKDYKDFVNGLIRQDLVKRVGASEDCTDEELFEQWAKYKEEIHKLFNQKF